MADCHICGAADAVAVCQQCRRLVCASDKIELDGRIYCKLCKPAGVPNGPVHTPAPSVDFLRRKPGTVLHSRYPAVEFAVPLLAVLSYVVLVVGVVLCLTFLIMAVTSQPEFRRLLLLRSTLSLTGAPIGFLVFQTLSQFFRILVDIEWNTRIPKN